jgi:hypothetical protein
MKYLNLMQLVTMEVYQKSKSIYCYRDTKTINNNWFSRVILKKEPKTYDVYYGFDGSEISDLSATLSEFNLCLDENGDVYTKAFIKMSFSNGRFQYKYFEIFDDIDVYIQEILNTNPYIKIK